MIGLFKSCAIAITMSISLMPIPQTYKANATITKYVEWANADYCESMNENWIFYGDFKEGEQVIITFYDNGTPNIKNDDRIIDAQKKETY